MVDHINHDTLDNQRSNLRLATNAQNQQNQHKARSDSLTGVRGVTYERNKNRNNRFRARLWRDGRPMTVGYFATAEQAAEALAHARRRHYTHAPECQEVAA